MADDVKEWLEKNCPQVIFAYKRSLIPFEQLVPGTKLITLRSGYGGSEGIVREVSSEIKFQGAERIVESYLNGAENPDQMKMRRYIEISSLTPDPYRNEISRGLLYEDDDRDGPWYFQVAIIHDYAAYLQAPRKAYWEREHLGAEFSDMRRLFQEKRSKP